MCLNNYEQMMKSKWRYIHRWFPAIISNDHCTESNDAAKTTVELLEDDTSKSGLNSMVATL